MLLFTTKNKFELQVEFFSVTKQEVNWKQGSVLQVVMTHLR